MAHNGGGESKKLLKFFHTIPAVPRDSVSHVSKACDCDDGFELMLKLFPA
jgi:hypothetical protein